MNLKEQLESARNYALARIEKGDFNLIEAFYDERLEDVRCLIEIDGYQISFVVVLEKDFMFQSSSHISKSNKVIDIINIIIFNRANAIPETIKEIAKEKLKEYNSNKKELEIRRLEKKLKELKNQ